MVTSASTVARYGEDAMRGFLAAFAVFLLAIGAATLFIP